MCRAAGYDDITPWLLAGDPAIRWQVMRDLLGSPRKSWEAERAKVARAGWGREFLDRQARNGVWGGGLYSPKWVSSTYTLLMLREMGVPPENPAAVRGCRRVLDGHVGLKRDQLSVHGCTCMCGMFLALGSYFDIEKPKLQAIVRHILAEQMPDGGWNCRKGRVRGTHHSSFHTTFNVLDGVREAITHRIGPTEKLKQAEARAIELMLMHRMYKSDKTGRLIHPAFAKLSHPHRWHYDVLRGLDYIHTTPFIGDRRLDDAFELLESKRLPDGRWALEHEYSGKAFFRMESRGEPSRWNTLRALRCLKARSR